MKTDKKTYCLYALLALLIASFNTASSLDRNISDAGASLNAAGSLFRRELTSISAGTTVGIVDYATNKLEKAGNRVVSQATASGAALINRAGAWGLLLYPQMNRFMQTFRLTGFQAMNKGVKELHESVNHVAAATEAATKEAAQVGHQLIDHTSMAAKEVIGRGINETKEAAKDVVNHSENAFNNSINNATFNINKTMLVGAAATVGVVGAVKSMDNTNSPARSIFCLGIGAAGFFSAYRLFRGVNTKSEARNSQNSSFTTQRQPAMQPSQTSSPSARPQPNSETSSRTTCTVTTTAAKTTAATFQQKTSTKTQFRPFHEWL